MKIVYINTPQNAVSEEERISRLSICQGCEHLVQNHPFEDVCGICECIVASKTYSSTETCPKEKW